MQLIKRAYKFRIYPQEEQLQVLQQWVGNTRFVYNTLLSINKELYKETKTFLFGNQMINSLPNLKKEHQFLKLNPSQSLQYVGKNLDGALRDFLKGKKGFPKFKSKHKHQDSLTIFQHWSVGKNSLKLPKLGKVKLKKHRAIKGKIKHITVSRLGNQWFVAVYAETKVKTKAKNYDSIVGIDVGLKQFATCSDGTVIANPRILLSYQDKLALQQRRLSKKLKGSKNYTKQKNKVTTIYRKIKNTRNDFQHKLSRSMIAKYGCIVVEYLTIRGMLKNGKLAKHIADVGWSEYIRQLIYKADWYGKVCIVIDRFEPTSKTCSNCQWIDQKLRLSDRVFTCQQCMLVIDRDLNAAINIANKGIEKLRQGVPNVKPVELVKLQTICQWPARKQEKEGLSPSCNMLD